MELLRNMISALRSGLSKTTTVKRVVKPSENNLGEFLKNNNATNVGIHTNPPKTIDPKTLKYKKAKTPEEAKQYAQKVLGIKDYDVPDVELANGINYAITDAIKKTNGKIGLPNNVYFRSIMINNAEEKSTAALVHRDGVNKNSLYINKDYIEETDKRIENLLKQYEEYGQIYKDEKGRDCIGLITGFNYKDTLNRYYRLYKAGKLDKNNKAKFDFRTLLYEANIKEEIILNRKDISSAIKRVLGTDISNLRGSAYTDACRKALVRIRNEKKILYDTEGFQVKRGLGFESDIHHELGHVTHFNSVQKSELTVQNANMTDDDWNTLCRISNYTAKSKSKFEAYSEYLRGLLSGDKFNKEITEWMNKNFPKISNIVEE